MIQLFLLVLERGLDEKGAKGRKEGDQNEA